MQSAQEEAQAVQGELERTKELIQQNADHIRDLLQSKDTQAQQLAQANQAKQALEESKKILGEELAAVKQDQEAAAAKIRKLEAKEIEQRRKLEEAGKKLGAQANELEGLQEQHRELQAMQRASQAREQELLGEIEKTRNEHAAAISEAGQRAKKLEAQNQTLAADLAASEAKNAEKEQNLREVGERLAAAQEEAKKAGLKLQELEQQKADVEAELRAAKDEIQKTQDLEREMQRQLAEVQSKLQEKEKDLAELQSSKGVSEEAVENAAAQLREAIDARNSLQIRLDEAATQLDALEQAKHKAEGEKERLAQQLALQQEKEAVQKKATEQLQQIIPAITAQKNEAEQKLIKEKEAVLQQERDIAELAKQCAERGEQILHLKRLIGDKQKILEDSEKALENAFARQRELEEMLALARGDEKKLADAEANAATAKGWNDLFLEELGKTREANKQLRLEVEKLKGEEIPELEEQAYAAKIAEDRAKKQAKAASEKVLELENKISGLLQKADEISGLKKQDRQAQQTITALKKELEREKQANKILQEDIADLKDENKAGHSMAQAKKILEEHAQEYRKLQEEVEEAKKVAAAELEKAVQANKTKEALQTQLDELSKALEEQKGIAEQLQEAEEKVDALTNALLSDDLGVKLQPGKDIVASIEETLQDLAAHAEGKLNQLNKKIEALPEEERSRYNALTLPFRKRIENALNEARNPSEGGVAALANTLRELKAAQGEGGLIEAIDGLADSIIQEASNLPNAKEIENDIAWLSQQAQVVASEIEERLYGVFNPEIHPQDYMAEKIEELNVFKTQVESLVSRADVNNGLGTKQDDLRKLQLYREQLKLALTGIFNDEKEPRVEGLLTRMDNWITGIENDVPYLKRRLYQNMRAATKEAFSAFIDRKESLLAGQKQVKEAGIDEESTPEFLFEKAMYVASLSVCQSIKEAKVFAVFLEGLEDVFAAMENYQVNLQKPRFSDSEPIQLHFNVSEDQPTFTEVARKNAENLTAKLEELHELGRKYRAVNPAGYRNKIDLEQAINNSYAESEKDIFFVESLAVYMRKFIENAQLPEELSGINLDELASRWYQAIFELLFGGDKKLFFIASAAELKKL